MKRLVNTKGIIKGVTGLNPEYKDISAEMIIEAINELPKSRSTFNMPIGHIGYGVYRISDNCLSDKNGFDLFKKELIKKGIAELEK